MSNFLKKRTLKYVNLGLNMIQDITECRKING